MFVGHSIGKPKSRHGGWWAFWLSWIGVIIVAVLPSNVQQSPEVVALSAKQVELADLEADVKMAELRQRQAALSGSA